MRTRLIATVLTASMVSGCAVGANYVRPEVPDPAAFRADTAPADLSSLADVKWFELFKDERLQEMIRTALVQNFDLRDAVVRVELARANLGITRADQFPTIEASAGLTSQRSGGGGEPRPQPAQPTGQHDGGEEEQERRPPDHLVEHDAQCQRYGDARERDAISKPGTTGDGRHRGIAGGSDIVRGCVAGRRWGFPLEFPADSARVKRGKL